MTVFQATDFSDHEQVVFASDAEAGLRAIIAIHDTRRGPAMGGCRIWRYPDEATALRDVLRLSKGMTYKATLAGAAFGGGKSVVLLGPDQQKTPQLIRSLGRAIDRLAGRYITGEDVGTTPEDMAEIRSITPHVLGATAAAGGSGDPSPSTALGCFVGIEASARRRLGATTLQGLRIAVQGLGKVGWSLCEQLSAAGARLIVTDLDRGRVSRAAAAFGAEAVDCAAIYAVEAEVFSPCAFGAVLNDETIPRLRAAIVAGAANNQLDRPEHGAALKARNILYAPDYVINGGGLIQLDVERSGYDAQAVERRVRGIADTLLELYDRAAAEGISTDVAADRLAAARLRSISPASAPAFAQVPG